MSADEPASHWPALRNAELALGELGAVAASTPRVQLQAIRGLVVGRIASPWAPELAAIADGYLRHGLAMLRHLDGEFAAVVLDTARSTLLATSSVTSRIPLAFVETPGCVLVSDRIIDLLSHPAVPRVLDESYLVHVITGLAYPAPGTTVVRGIKRLRPGEGLLVTRGHPRVISIDELGRRPHRHFATFRDASTGFWDALDRSTAGRANPVRRPCLSLSGGLDSAAVGLALSRSVGRVETFSIVAVGCRDESAPIRAVEDILAARQTHVDCADAFDLGELQEMPLRDDPVLIALPMVPGTLRLWKAMRDHGFDTVFEGYGGDEIFELNVSPLQAIRRGQLAAAESYLRSHPMRRTLMWRGVILPHLPSAARGALYRRWTRRDSPLPSYLKRGRSKDALVRTALQQYFDAMVHRSLARGLREWISTPVFMGARVAYEQMLRSLDLEIAAPLADREVIDLVLAVPPAWMLSPDYERAFLRRSLEGRIPDNVRLRPKDVRLVDDLAPQVLIYPTTRAMLADPRVRSRLSDWIRFDAVDHVLDDISRGYRPPHRLMWQLQCLTCFAQWYGRASREYGVD